MREEIELIPSNPLSDEAKAKLKRILEKRDEHLRKMKEDYENGVYDEFIKTLPENK